jgi:hypothetical protein
MEMTNIAVCLRLDRSRFVEEIWIFISSGVASRTFPSSRIPNGVGSETLR